MKITKREIVVSLSIIAIMFVIGMLISDKISDALMDSYEKYKKAIHIDNTELFKYGMETNVGNAFIYGELKTVDPVSYSDVEGEYLSLTKNTEEYTKHTTVVTKTDSEGNEYTEIEEYWSWDVIKRESLKAQKVMFCGVEFLYSQFENQSEAYIKTAQKSVFSDIRYVYYGCPAKMMGTVFAYLIGDNISQDKAVFFRNMTIEQTIDYLNSNAGLIAFWIFWVLFIGGTVYAFYCLDNKWLEN